MPDNVKRRGRRLVWILLLAGIAIGSFLLYSSVTDAWHRRTRVIQWLKAAPHPGRVPGWKLDEWELAGRRIYRCEDVLREIYCRRDASYRGELKYVSDSRLVGLIGTVGTERSVPWLISVAKDVHSSPEARATAVRVLGYLEDPRAIPLFTKILQEGGLPSLESVANRRVIYSAILSLGTSDDSRLKSMAEASLVRSLGQSDAENLKAEFENASGGRKWESQAIQAIRNSLALFVKEHAQDGCHSMSHLNLTLAELEKTPQQEGEGYWRIGRWTISKLPKNWEASIDTDSAPEGWAGLTVTLFVPDDNAHIRNWSLRTEFRRKLESEESKEPDK